ncbi:hypothetical protein AAFF_G00384950 [Aldrovandia affinis]|uniref:Uncharacterized protein n=1 Tax=Aldrovandia affinis TaxID=143900 RepID=A0AAD7WMA2_9TELE|nr:hypothetical protein AAFF_G00384950 [Aldrovandia affinis]
MEERGNISQERAWLILCEELDPELQWMLLQDPLSGLRFAAPHRCPLNYLSYRTTITARGEAKLQTEDTNRSPKPHIIQQACPILCQMAFELLVTPSLV